MAHNDDLLQGQWDMEIPTTGELLQQITRSRREWKLVQSNLPIKACGPMFSGYTRIESVRNGGPSAKVSECRLHPACSALLKMQKSGTTVEGEMLYSVFSCGEHSTTDGAVWSLGLNPLVLDYIDPQLKAGKMPLAMSTQLRAELEKASKFDILSALPQADVLYTQLKHRKKQLFAVHNASTEHDLNVDLNAHSLDLYKDAVQVQAELVRLKKTIEGGDNGLIVLSKGIDGFRRTDPLDDTDGDGEGGGSQPLDVRDGFVFSSPAVLDNVNKMLRDQYSGVSLEIDGTFKLLTGTWTLLVLGTHTVRPITAQTGRASDSSHSLIPLLFAVTKAESQASVGGIVQVLKLVGQKLFNCSDLGVKCCTMDHSDSLRSGCLQQLGADVRILNCWPHVRRNAERMAGKLKCMEFFNAPGGGADMLGKVHKATTTAEFTVLAALMLRDWEDNGHTEYAAWLRKGYLSAAWSGWRYGASGIPGVTSNNNAMEAYNGEIKDLLKERKSMASFLSTGIPDLLAGCRHQRTPEFITRDIVHDQYQRIVFGVVPTDMVQKVLSMLRNPVCGRKLVNTTTFRPAWFVNDSSTKDTEMTMERLTLKQKTTDLDSSTFAEACTRFLTVHKVLIIAPSVEEEAVAVSSAADATDGLSSAASSSSSSSRSSVAAMTTPPAAQRRGGNHCFYSCDCKGFFHTGYLCSHVLFCMAKDCALDMKTLVSKFDTSNTGGRVPKRKAAMQTMTAATVDSSDPNLVEGAAAQRLLKTNLSGAELRGCGRHSHCGNGFVVSKDGEVYTVHFDRNDTTDTVSAAELVKYMFEYKAFKSSKMLKASSDD